MFNALQFGGIDPTGNTDSASGFATAISTVQAVQGELFIPAGTYRLDSALSIDGTKGSISIIGEGVSTVLKAHSSMTAVISSTDQKYSIFRDFYVHGNGVATNGIKMTMPSGETSTGNQFYNVTIYDCTDYHLYLDGHEDTYVIGCSLVPTNLNTNALYWNIPNGAAAVLGSRVLDMVELTYQQFEVSGSVLGSVQVNNSGSATTPTLGLHGCYIYDSTTSGRQCICAADQFTNITVDSCYLVTGSQQHWVNGTVPAGVTVAFRNSGFVMGSGNTNATVSLFNTTGGTGVVVFEGCGGSGSATTKNVFSATTAGVVAWVRTIVSGFTHPSMVAGASTPAVPTTGTPLTNPFGVPVAVIVAGGVLTGNTVVDGVTTVATTGTFALGPDSSIKLTYTTAPTWTWSIIG